MHPSQAVRARHELAQGRHDPAEDGLHQALHVQVHRCGRDNIIMSLSLTILRLHPGCVLSRGGSVAHLVRLGPLVPLVTMLHPVWRGRDQEAEIMSGPRLPGGEQGSENTAATLQ